MVQKSLITTPSNLKHFACPHLHVCTPQWSKAGNDFVSPQFQRDGTLHQTRDAGRDAEMQNTIFISNFPSDFRQQTIISTYAVDQHTDVTHLVPCLCVGTDRYKVFISVEYGRVGILAWEYCHAAATQSLWSAT